VEHEHGEVEDAAGDALAVHLHVLLVQVPAARAHLQRGDLVVELVGLAALLEHEFAADRLAQVDLALDLVGPVRCVRILEVGHVAVRARIERVDDHLRLDRAGDLDAPALERLGDRRDSPVAVTHRSRLRQEVRTLALIQALGPRDPIRQQLPAARLVLPMQLRDERERVVREDLGEFRGDDGRVYGDALRQVQRGFLVHFEAPVADEDRRRLPLPAGARFPAEAGARFRSRSRRART
jgi:hypothetical protein